MPPAARLTDPVLHLLPPGLTPGTGSPDVLTGFLPTWRGLPAAAAAALLKEKKTFDDANAVCDAAVVAASGTPDEAAAVATQKAVKEATKAAMAASIMAAAAAFGADVHICVLHGPGVVVDPSKTVFVNHQPVARMGDHVLEASGVPNVIIAGLPTVIIGG